MEDEDIIDYGEYFNSEDELTRALGTNYDYCFNNDINEEEWTLSNSSYLAKDSHQVSNGNDFSPFVIESLPSLPPLNISSLPEKPIKTEKENLISPKYYRSPPIVCWTALIHTDCMYVMNTIDNWVLSQTGVRNYSIKNFCIDLEISDIKMHITTYKLSKDYYISLVRRMYGDPVVFTNLFSQIFPKIIHNDQLPFSNSLSDIRNKYSSYDYIFCSTYNLDY